MVFAPLGGRKNGLRIRLEQAMTLWHWIHESKNAPPAKWLVASIVVQLFGATTSHGVETTLAPLRPGDTAGDYEMEQERGRRGLLVFAAFKRLDSEAERV